MMSDDGITLENQLLIEDDAPACSTNWQRNIRMEI